jgi:hypothetical protein
MPRTFDRLRLFFLLAFAICCAITWTYHFMYVWPRHQCEQKGDWWDSKDRVCAVPMPIWAFTGRMPRPKTPAAPSTPPASAR